MRTVHVMIHGTVQGVWFRANTEKQALKRDLVGWVRNTVNGEVEAVFQGDDDVVEESKSVDFEAITKSIQDVFEAIADVKKGER